MNVQELDGKTMNKLIARIKSRWRGQKAETVIWVDPFGMVQDQELNADRLEFFDCGNPSVVGVYDGGVKATWVRDDLEAMK